MRFTPYDDVLEQPITTTSVAIQSFTGSTAVDSDSVDTGAVFVAESIMIHVRAEIASGAPTAATLAWALQELSDNSTWAAANDNTGTAIGATLNVHTTAQDSYARIEGIMLNRKRYLRVVFTPAFTGGTSPAILGYASIVGSPASGQSLPVRTQVSNT